MQSVLFSPWGQYRWQTYHLCSTYLVSQDIIFGFRSDCASWLFVQSYCKEPSLPPSLAICVIYVLTTFFRSLARSSECTLLRPLAPSSREVLITVASGMRTSWRRPSLPLRTRAHHEPLHAHRCRCFRDGRSTFPFHTDSRTALDKSHLSDQHSRTFYHLAKRVTN